MTFSRSLPFCPLFGKVTWQSSSKLSLAPKIDKLIRGAESLGQPRKRETGPDIYRSRYLQQINQRTFRIVCDENARHRQVWHGDFPNFVLHIHSLDRLWRSIDFPNALQLCKKMIRMQTRCKFCRVTTCSELLSLKQWFSFISLNLDFMNTNIYFRVLFNRCICCCPLKAINNYINTESMYNKYIYTTRCLDLKQIKRIMFQKLSAGIFYLVYIAWKLDITWCIRRALTKYWLCYWAPGQC